MDRNDAIKKIYAMLKAELDEIVQGIEGGVPMTQNNYGAYMQALGNLRSAGLNKAVSAELLVLAGGNRAGIASALSLS